MISMSNLRSAVGRTLLCSLLFLCVPVNAQDQDPRKAALFLYGALQAGAATLLACREADPPNSTAYLAVTGQLFSENLSTFERINEVLRTEGTRAGLGSAYYLQQYYPKAVAMAADMAKRERTADPAAFLANCRGLPEAARRHEGYFRPLRDKFPSQMRTLDDWR
jgi:hypothetical protein